MQGQSRAGWFRAQGSFPLSERHSSFPRQCEIKGCLASIQRVLGIVNWRSVSVLRQIRRKLPERVSPLKEGRFQQPFPHSFERNFLE